MSDKNLQASVELQVSTPGAEKLTQLKKEVTDLLRSLGSAGSSISLNLDKAAVSATKAAATAQKARESEQAAQLAHTRRLEADALKAQERSLASATRHEQRLVLEAEKARTKRAALAQGSVADQARAESEITAARIKAEATREAAALKSAAAVQRANLAASTAKAQLLAQAERAGEAATQREIRNIERVAAAQARAQAAAVQRQLVQNARDSNPNTFGNQRADRNAGALQAASLAEQAALAQAQANSFGGKFKSTMGNWGKSSSEAFTQSFGTGMLGGMGKVLITVGALFGAKSFLKDNIADANVYYSLLAANNNDAKASKKDKHDLYDMANAHGMDYLKTGDKVMGVYSSAKANGMENNDIKQMLSGFFDLFQARHIPEGNQNRAMIAIAEGLSTDRLGRKEAIRQLGINDIHGLAPFIEKFIMEQSGGKLKSKEDVMAALAHKKTSDGKNYDVDPETFFKKFADWLHKQYGEAAKTASDESPQTAIAQFHNAIHDLNIELGESGAIGAFTGAVKGLTEVLKDPETVASIRDFGGWIKTTAEDMKPGISSMMQFSHEHNDGIKTLGLAVLGVTGFNLAVKLLIAPFMAAGNSLKVFWGALTKGGALMETAGTALVGMADGFAGAIGKTFESVGAAFNLAGGPLGKITGVLGELFGVALKVLGPIGELIGLFDTIKTLMGHWSADSLIERDTSKMDSKQKMAHVAQLRTEAKESTNSTVSWLLDKGSAAVNWAARTNLETDRGGKRAARYTAMADSVESGATIADKIAAAEAAQAAKPKTGKELVNDGTGKGNKGRNGHATVSEMVSAEKYASDTKYADEMQSAKVLRDAQVKLNTEMLEKNLISFKTFYDKKRVLAGEELDAEEAAVTDKVKAEIKQQEQLRGKARDKTDIAAADLRIATLRTHLAAQLAGLEDKRAGILAGINTAEAVDAKKASKQSVDVKHQIDKLRGFGTATSLDGNVDEEYKDKLASARANVAIDGDGPVKNLELLISLLKEKSHLQQLDEVAAVSNLSYENRIAEVNHEVLTGTMGRLEADNRILALKKEEAAAAYKLLEAEKQSTTNQLQKEEIQKRQNALLDVMVQKTQAQQQLEQGVQSSIASGITALLDGTKSLGSALKGALKETTAGIGKTLADGLSQKATGYLTGKGGENKDGGVDVLGSLGSMLGFGPAKGDSSKVGTMFVKSLVVEGGMPGAGGSESSGGLLGLAGKAIAGWFGGGDAAGAAAGGSSVDWSGMIGSAASAAGGSVPGFAKGGAVFGAGSSTSDSIDAKLSHGEYVLPPEMVARLGGVNVLDDVRLGVPHFANGGLITAAGKSAAGGGATTRMAGNAAGVVMNISTPDAGSFRAAESQILSRMQLASQRAQRRNY